MNQRIAYLIIQSIFACMGLLPWSWRDRLGKALGRLIYRLDKRHQKVVIQNLTIAFGNEKSPKEIKKIARNCFENLGRICFEIGWISINSTRETLKNYEVRGCEYICRAHQKGKGVLILTAHFGNWELLRESGYVVQQRFGWKSNIVARRLDFLPLEQFFSDVRVRLGTRVLKTRQNAFQTIIDVLAEKTIKNHVVLLNDQRVDWFEGVFVDFFGQPACTNTGLARLTKQTGAPVVPLYVIRSGKGFIAEFQPEIPWIPTGDDYWDIAVNTHRYNKNIEAMIRRYPDQWFWVHNRWKTPPYCPWPKP